MTLKITKHLHRLEKFWMMGVWWSQWSLKSLTTRLFIQQLVQATKK